MQMKTICLHSHCRINRFLSLSLFYYFDFCRMKVIRDVIPNIKTFSRICRNKRNIKYNILIICNCVCIYTHMLIAY